MKGLLWVFVFLLGFAAGGWVFHDVQPRTWLTVHGTKVHASHAELLGYLGSAIVQRAPGLVPQVVMETDKSVAMKYPIPDRSEEHYVVVPKRDIKDVQSLAKGDEPYLLDAFAVIGELARERKMKHYKIISNSPAEQDVRYLHFHLVAVRPQPWRWPWERKPAPPLATD